MKFWQLQALSNEDLCNRTKEWFEKMKKYDENFCPDEQYQKLKDQLATAENEFHNRHMDWKYKEIMFSVLDPDPMAVGY